MDAGAFEECLRSDSHAEEVTRNLRLGESLGVNGTPSFMLNGQRAQFSDFNDLEQRVYQLAGIVEDSNPAEGAAAGVAGAPPAAGQ